MFKGASKGNLSKASSVKQWRSVRHIICAVSGFGLLGLLSSPTYAQTLSEEVTEEQGLASPTSGDWNVTLGPGLVLRPRYPGASSDRVRFFPLFSIQYKDLLFLGPGGLGMNAINWDGFRAGPVLGFEGGRNESADPDLNGLGNISPSITAGGFVSYNYGPWSVYGTVRQAITHTSNGLNALLRADYRATLVPKKLVLFVGPEVSLANGESNRTWFGINSEQSVQSGLPVFTPSGGLRDVGLHATLSYRLTDHILFHAFASVKELTGNITDSPIVQSKTEKLAGLGIAYHF